MSPKTRTLRFKLYSLLSLPIVALIALWTFTTAYLVGDAFDLRRASALYELVSAPADTLCSRIQEERRLSGLHVSGAFRPDSLAGLAEARSRTDRAVAALREQVTSETGRATIPADLSAAVEDLLEELERLPGIREDVDARTLSRAKLLDDFGRIQDALFRVYDRLITVSEIELYKQAGGLRQLAHGWDLLSQEDALLAGAIMDGVLRSEEREIFTRLVANRRMLLDQGLRALDPELRRPYDMLLAGHDYRQILLLEGRIVAGGPLPADRAAWQSPVQLLRTSAERIGTDRAELVNARRDSAAGWVFGRLAIAGGVGLLAILGAVVLSARLGRGMARELADLRTAALHLADERLPAVVDRLRRGEIVDVEAEAPPIRTTGTTMEVHDVAQAFSTVQRTAVQAAVGQAELRHGINQVFRNLARRNQSLVHRQLSQLDAMQRKTTTPEALADLFRLDHMTTRMRRQAEGLIILSGSAAGRTWRKPVLLLNVIRGAIAEVEDYPRVDVLPVPDVRLIGSAVTDVVHLLAELIENATLFSPPSTTVTVRGSFAGQGFAVEVEDRGLGIGEAEREELNRRLANPPEFDLADSDRLGLFVVGRLAERHDIKVTLNRSPYGGTTAVVLLPRSLLVLSEESDSGLPTGAAARE